MNTFFNILQTLVGIQNKYYPDEGLKIQDNILISDFKKDKLIELTFNLLNQVTILIKQDNKKNEVDEMSENIAILYNKELFNGCEQKIDDKNFMETITIFAHSKVKSYASLSNKSIFKFMDMIEM